MTEAAFRRAAFVLMAHPAFLMGAYLVFHCAMTPLAVRNRGMAPMIIGNRRFALPGFLYLHGLLRDAPENHNGNKKRSRNKNDYSFMFHRIISLFKIFGSILFIAR